MIGEGPRAAYGEPPQKFRWQTQGIFTLHVTRQERLLVIAVQESAVRPRTGFRRRARVPRALL